MCVMATFDEDKVMHIMLSSKKHYLLVWNEKEKQIYYLMKFTYFCCIATCDERCVLNVVVTSVGASILYFSAFRFINILIM